MKILKQIFLGMMLIASPVATANDQEVLIEQAGDNVIIEANQEGYDNVIDIDPDHVIGGEWWKYG